MKTVLHFLLTLVVYALFELAFIKLFAKAFIEKQVGHLLAPKPDLVAVLVFYLIFIAGLLYFCVYPALKEGSTSLALFNGAFFGLATYATYELTNKALIDKWTLPLVLVDIAWGIFVGAAVSFVSFIIGKALR